MLPHTTISDFTFLLFQLLGSLGICLGKTSGPALGGKSDWVLILWDSAVYS